MVTTLRIMPEYLCFPVWLHDEKGRIIDDALPEELLGDESLKRQFDALRKEFDALFIDDGQVFDYRGFRSEEEKQSFIQKWRAAVAELTEKTHGRYEIVDDLAVGFGWK